MDNYLLPPQMDKSPKKELLKTIDLLEKEGCKDIVFKLINALAQGIIWSKETDAAVRKLGLEIAKELYWESTQNTEYEVTISDPENPSNWQNY